MTSSTAFSSIETAPYGSTEKITLVSSSTSLTLEPVQSAKTARLLKSDEMSRTDFASVAIGTEQKINPSPIERVYPHLFDDAGPANQFRIYISKALRDAQLALESFGEADLESVGSRLTLVATTMGGAHPLTNFNESLGAVVSFVRRATLTASYADITRSALNALVHVLQSAITDPMLDLDEASDLVDKLSSEGWRGEHGVVNELIAVLLDDLDTEAGAEIQAQLFSEDETKAD